MFSGRDALREIDQAIHSLRDEQETITRRIEQTSDGIARLREEQAAKFRALAEIRLDIVRRETVIDSLTRTERKARQMLDKRQKTLSGLGAEVEAGEARRLELEKERAELADAVDARDRALAEAEEAFVEALENDPDYQAHVRALDEAEKIAEEAARKTELARDDRAEKGKPYEADPLFTYLWERGFGTDRYRASPIIRMLDRWVARLIRYYDARPNYHRLLELPERLAEHAERVAKAAEDAADSLEAFEARQRQSADVGRLEVARDEAAAKLAEIDEAIAAESARRNELEAERGLLARGEDDEYRSAIDLLTEAMERQDLRALHREALLTPEREDETLVERIADLQDDIADANDDLSERREILRDLEKRRVELEDVRTRFVRRKFDDRDSYFDDDNFLKSLLGGILRGAISGGGLWREIERHQRRQQRRTRRSRSMPRWGSGRGGFGGRSGGFGGGGFRTGGRMGGGGFRTGGGF